MALNQLLGPELHRELAIVRRTLERAPEDQPDFKPHPTSMPFARLAGLVAQLPAFISIVLTTPHCDLSSSGLKPIILESRDKLLSAFDDYAAKAESDLAATSDETLNQPWKLTFQDRVIFAGTRYEALRAMGISHLIHHRAQLGVYLRLLGQPVPSMYGPSADEFSAP